MNEKDDEKKEDDRKREQDEARRDNKGKDLEKVIDQLYRGRG